MTYSDLYIHTEDAAHSVKVAHAVGILDPLDTEIPFQTARTKWEPASIQQAADAKDPPLDAVTLQAIGALLADAPEEGWDVRYLQSTAPNIADPIEPLDGPQPFEQAPGEFWVARVYAPDPVTDLLVAQLVDETWLSGLTLYNVLIGVRRVVNGKREWTMATPLAARVTVLT